MTPRKPCFNVGAGLSAGESWYNIDGSYSLRLARLPGIGPLLTRLLRLTRWPRSVVYGDIVRGLPLAAGELELVFASHVLEHLTREDFSVAVSNIHAYLRPGGCFRCIVPDLAVLVGEYTRRLGSTTASEAATASDYLLNASHLGATSPRRTARARLHEAASNSRHQWMWDRTSLAGALEQAGFENVGVRGYGDWADERFAEVETEERHTDSVCLEAFKPRS